MARVRTANETCALGWVALTAHAYLDSEAKQPTYSSHLAVRACTVMQGSGDLFAIREVILYL